MTRRSLIPALTPHTDNRCFLDCQMVKEVRVVVLEEAADLVVAEVREVRVVEAVPLPEVVRSVVLLAMPCHHSVDLMVVRRDSPPEDLAEMAHPLAVAEVLVAVSSFVVV